jgi:hypothetical protein
MSREITIPAQTIKQEIQSLKESPDDKEVIVIVGITDDMGKFIVPQQFKSFSINGEMYIELNSANPSWHPEKPEGTFFNEDLWHFIDLLQN